MCVSVTDALLCIGVYYVCALGHVDAACERAAAVFQSNRDLFLAGLLCVYAWGPEVGPILLDATKLFCCATSSFILGAPCDYKNKIYQISIVVMIRLPCTVASECPRETSEFRFVRVMVVP